MQLNETALSYFSILVRREKINTMIVADTMKKLVDVLNASLASEKSTLEVSVVQFIVEHLNISKSLVSQYLSIAGIRSQNVKQSLIFSNVSVNKAYYISRIKGRTFLEIETSQMTEINRISSGNNKLILKIKAAQMILKNVSGAKSIEFIEMDIKCLLTNPEIIINKIEKCVEIIAPYTKRVKILSDQLGYCNFLLVYNNECKCLCGSEISISELRSKKVLLIDEILSMQDQVISEKKYTSLLLLAKKDLEAVINSGNN